MAASISRCIRLKDLETEMPPGIVLACTLKREDARDCLLLGPTLPTCDPADPFAALPQGAVIGTSSVRRQSQLLHRRPDLRVVMFRGNVADAHAQAGGGRGDGDPAGAGGACAGSDSTPRAAWPSTPRSMVPSAGQGIVGVTVRVDNTELRELLAAIEDPEARAVSSAERALLAALDGSCRTPIGGHARLLPDGRLRLTGLVARADGTLPAEAHRGSLGEGRGAAGGGTRPRRCGATVRRICLPEGPGRRDRPIFEAWRKAQGR